MVIDGTVNALAEYGRSKKSDVEHLNFKFRRGSKIGCFGFQLTIFCPPLHSQHQCSSTFKECGI
jgi:hypothetical protein